MDSIQRSKSFAHLARSDSDSYVDKFGSAATSSDMSRTARENVADLNWSVDASSPRYGFPLDWDTDKQYIGVSRSASVRRYVVRLSACGKQFAFATTTSQHKAAKLYDWANWKLAAFLRKPQFNFPESFAEMSQGECPEALNKIYDECNRLKPLSPDLTEREHREAAFQRLLDGVPQEIKRDQTSSYGRAQRVAARIQTNLVRDRMRLVELHGKLKLTKLPELEAKLAQLEANLQAVADESLQVAYAMERHTGLYKSFQEVGNE